MPRKKISRCLLIFLKKTFKFPIKINEVPKKVRSMFDSE
ncbi:hypothetical protein SAMN05216522_101187 [Rosenbergiella nectarea]|uniref:Uncharacterized protein n=1 Tax=Rosenbergiella nectarea TaxID=988801 RepID=A0A1H9D960_9GAMM|nr:hypothetical protein SAMN05216522_101187 [Rosenbergiella nectarea]